MDRGIEIMMRRKLKSEPVAKWFGKRANREADPIRRQLVRWTQDRRVDFEDEIEATEHWCPGWLVDREAELWTPLLAILRLADLGLVSELEASPGRRGSGRRPRATTGEEQHQ